MNSDFSDELVGALVQVFTRNKTNLVWISIDDGGPIPPYRLTVRCETFMELLKRSDLSKLSVKSLVDLGTLYFSELNEILAEEMARRKESDPDFSKKLMN